MLIVNAGSQIPETGAGWTNTLDQARKNAQDWFDTMRGSGFTDLEMTLQSEDPVDDRWRFVFTHTVTGATAELDMHGVDNIDAFRRQTWGYPRAYWNGGSSSEPQLEDFAADGFEPVMTYRAKR